MSYTAQPMTDLWRRLAQCEGLCTFSLVRDTASALSESPFADAFAAAVERAAEVGDVLPATRETLLAFGEGCGHTDLEGQQAHISYYRTLLTAQEEEAHRRYKEQGRVYRVLGLTAGVALALLLM